jgi:DNA-binding transcriptional ArsR family regulator
MESGAKEREVPAPVTQPLIQVLKDPLRARIAAGLEKRDTSPEELAEVLGEPLALVAYHYDVLAAVGLV